MTIDLETTGRQLLIDVRVTGACMQLVPTTQMCSERVELFLEKFYKGADGICNDPVTFAIGDWVNVGGTYELDIFHDTGIRRTAQVYDENGDVVVADYNNATTNKITLKNFEPYAGSAIII